MPRVPPLLSILLPVYNAAATLPRCLASLRAQTLEDWELIAVDDGSSDASPALLKEAARRDPRILFIAQAHAGVVAAANRARSYSSGHYIARMDADDEAAPERLAQQVARLEADASLDFASCLVRFGGDGRAQGGFARHVDWINSVITPAEHALAQFLEFPLANPTLCGRGAAWERAGDYAEGDFPEDYVWFLRAMERGLRFAKVEAELLTWHDPPARLTRTDRRYRVEAFFTAKLPFLTRWLQREVKGGRPLYVWGAGRRTRQRLRPLRTAGTALAGWVDIDRRKIGGVADGLPVIRPEDLLAGPGPRPFILPAVRSRGAGTTIATWLEENGFHAGEDYLLLA
ncbi:MAG: glycosyltransferase family 2 protein [Opitutales bacterium]